MKITGTETKKYIIDRIERHLKDAKEVSYSREVDTKEIPGGVERNGVMCEAFETTGTTYINLVIKKEEEEEQEPEPDHRKQREIENEERVNQSRMENKELNHRYRELKNRIELEHIEDLVDHLNYIEKRIGEQFGEFYYSYTLFNESDTFSPIKEYRLSGFPMGASYIMQSKSIRCHENGAAIYSLRKEIRNAKLRLKDAERRQDEKKIKRLRWIRNGIIVAIWIALAYII